MQQSCLVLNASYEPLRMFDVPRAIRLVLQGKAEIVESTGKQLRSGSQTIDQPSVIRLVKLVKVPKRLRRQVSNTFLFARDHYQCQYCGRFDRELRQREFLNRDHIVPQSKGGGNTWDNCVTACSSCNAKKDNKLPHEAGLTLRSKPTEPHLVLLKWKVRKLTPLQERYLQMFFGENWREQVSQNAEAKR
jgi:5-methylcytosine-specific restriction endonuclease McrA